MQAPPDDLFQKDTSTFPTVDPATAAALAKQQAQIDKERKSNEAERRKQEAHEEKLAKKMNDMPIKAPTTKQVASSIDKQLAAVTLKKQKIKLYFSKLGHKLSIKEPKALPEDAAKVDDLLTAIETELHSNGGIEQATGLYIQGIFGFEILTQNFNPLGLKLSGPNAGLTNTIQANRAKWDELVTEFAIANAEWFMMGPFKRLIGFTIQSIMAVDAANRSGTGGQKPAPKEKQEEAEEL